MTDPLALHRAIQVGHSMNMVAELPRYVNNESWPVGLRVAAIDAFFTHLRNLIEFLVKQPKRTIRAMDYAGDFQVNEKPLRRRLLNSYSFACSHVDHLDKARTPTATAAVLQTVPLTQLQAHAEDVFTAMDAFVQHLKTRRNPYAAEFERLLSEAQSR